MQFVSENSAIFAVAIFASCWRVFFLRKPPSFVVRWINLPDCKKVNTCLVRKKTCVVDKCISVRSDSTVGHEFNADQ